MYRSRVKTCAVYGFALIIVLTFPVAPSATGTTFTPAPSEFTQTCSTRGGVNCSIIRSDASVVCNDGTVDDTAIIYAVPQCREAIEATVQEQSRFIAESGCIPPGEMACINETSYQNLLTHLTERGVAASDLGRYELLQCRQQINEYQKKAAAHRECLAKNNNPDFSLPTNRITLPILKTLFCPIFYGDQSTYAPDLDMCTCPAGQFLIGDRCQQATAACQSLRGTSYIAQGGNCIASSNSGAVPTISFSPARPSPTPLLPNDGAFFYIPAPTPVHTPIVSTPSASPEPPTAVPGLNPFRAIWRSVTSLVQTVLNLF